MLAPQPLSVRVLREIIFRRFPPGVAPLVMVLICTVGFDVKSVGWICRNSRPRIRENGSPRYYRKRQIPLYTSAWKIESPGNDKAHYQIPINVYC